MPSRPNSFELFDLDGHHNRQDAALHQPILDDGDHDAAIEVSRQVMRRLGFSDARIDRLLKPNSTRAADIVMTPARPPMGWTISKDSPDIVRYDPDQPRGDDGRWTSDGSGDGGDGNEGGADETHGSSAAGAGRGVPAPVHERPSRPYAGASAEIAGGGRLLDGAAVRRSYVPTVEQIDYARGRGATPLTFHELGKYGGEVFHAAVAAAKAKNPLGAAVTLHSADDYSKMRTFLSDDGKVGFALQGDDIISVFRDPSSTATKAVASILALAVQQGGRRLDCFDTALPTIYSAEGFRAVARTPFDDNDKPDGWNEDDFKAYRGGKPDVVFMVHDAQAGPYVKGDGKRYSTYDGAMAAQEKEIQTMINRGVDGP